MNGPGRPPENRLAPDDRRTAPAAGRGQPGTDPDVPRSVGASLDEYLASQGLLGMRTLGEIVACWAGVVGEDVAAHAQPRSVGRHGARRRRRPSRLGDAARVLVGNDLRSAR